MIEPTAEDKPSQTAAGPRPAWVDWARVFRVVIGAAGVLAMIMLLFPGTRRPKPRPNRAGPDVRLARLAMAINDYGTLNKRYPPRAVCAGDGTPLLSWRVLVLPLLGEEKLFAEFRLNEAWDSPHNRALLSRRPDVFDHPHRFDLPPTHTAYLSLMGPGAVIHDAPAGLALGEAPDGMVHTAILAETAKGDVPWTKPSDIDIELHPRIGDPHGVSGLLGDGAFVAFLDTKSVFLPSRCPPELLRAMVSASGGEHVPTRAELRDAIDNWGERHATPRDAE
jgi:hypothetical protein